MTVTPLTDRHDQGPGTSCPDPELLASYIDGVATPRERSEIESHLAACADCYFVLTETIHEQRQHAKAVPAPLPVRRRTAWVPWLAAGAAVAAALMLALRIGGPIRRGPQPQQATAVSTPSTSPSPTPRGVVDPNLKEMALALNSLQNAIGEFRPLAPRLSSASEYRPLKPVTRSATSAEDLPESVRQAARPVEDLSGAPGASNADKIRLAMGLAEMFLMTGRPQQAIAVLEPMVSGSGSAALQADLAAAYLARGDSGDPARARDAAEQAVKLDPARPEAWFNLALAAEALDVPSQATDAWSRVPRTRRNVEVGGRSPSTSRSAQQTAAALTQPSRRLNHPPRTP